MEDEKRVMRIPDLIPPLQVPGGLAYSDFEKAEALTDNLESQFQPVPVSPMQMDNVERVRGAMESFAQTTANEPRLTNPTEISKAITELKAGKASGSVRRVEQGPEKSSLESCNLSHESV